MEADLPARTNYIYDTMHLWCMVSEKGNFIELTSIPSTCLDVAFVVGHNYDVKAFLKTASISETLIVAISCNSGLDLKKGDFPRKKIYLSKQTKDGYSELLDGNEFGLKFNPTESELIFYNTYWKENIINRLNKAFQKI